MEEREPQNDIQMYRVTRQKSRPAFPAVTAGDAQCVPTSPGPDSCHSPRKGLYFPDDQVSAIRSTHVLHPGKGVPMRSGTSGPVLLRLVLLAILGMSGSGRLGAQVFLKDRFPHLTFNGPVGVCHPNDSTDRLCVVEQGGTIRIFPDDSTVTSAKVFLDISDSIVSGGEMPSTPAIPRTDSSMSITTATILCGR